jgi:hypothetical protein
VRVNAGCPRPRSDYIRIGPPRRPAPRLSRGSMRWLYSVSLARRGWHGGGRARWRGWRRTSKPWRPTLLSLCWHAARQAYEKAARLLRWPLGKHRVRNSTSSCWPSCISSGRRQTQTTTRLTNLRVPDFHSRNSIIKRQESMFQLPSDGSGQQQSDVCGDVGTG